MLGVVLSALPFGVGALTFGFRHSMMGCVIKLKRSGITRIRIMRPSSKDIVDHRLDAEDCSHHCPTWFVLSLASAGVLCFIGSCFLG